MIIAFFKRWLNYFWRSAETASADTQVPPTVTSAGDPISLEASVAAEKPYATFVMALRQRESGGNYQIKNPFGYMGAYQFGMARLCDFGLTARKPGETGGGNKSFAWVSPFTEAGFLGSEALQDRLFTLHVLNLVANIKRSVPQALGKTFMGLELTLSGAVACCHLLGLGGLKAFISPTLADDKPDALGTQASDYVKLFAGYHIPESLPLDGGDLKTLLKVPPAV